MVQPSPKAAGGFTATSARPRPDISVPGHGSFPEGHRGRSRSAATPAGLEANGARNSNLIGIVGIGLTHRGIGALGRVGRFFDRGRQGSGDVPSPK